MTFSVDEIKDLMRTLADTGLTELRLKDEEGELRLTRGAAAPAAAPAALPAPAQPPLPAAPPSPPAAEEKGGTLVYSPIVGTFYARPTPQADPYVRVGDTVRKGDVLFIIESMKLMNEVPSEYDGVVAEVLAKDGEPVEYGQAILRLE